MMTAKAQKRLLRSTVDFKVMGLMQEKARSFILLGVFPTDTEVTIVSQKWSIDLLWEIIDGLIDQLVEKKRKGAKR